MDEVPPALGAASLLVVGPSSRSRPKELILHQLSGSGAEVEQDSGWRNQRFDLSFLPAGTHSVTIGVYNNAKDETSELTRVLFDDFKVTFTEVNPPSFAQWSALNLSGGLDGPAEDFDGNGIENLREFGYGFAGTEGEQDPETGGMVENVATSQYHLELTFPRLTEASGLTIIAESGNDLAEWNELYRWESGTVIVNGGLVSETPQGDQVLVHVRDPQTVLGNARRFIRSRFVQE